MGRPDTDHPARLTLKPGRERSLHNRHPWIFSGAIASLEGYREPGDRCVIHDSRGRPLATGYANRLSQITARVLTFADEPDAGHGLVGRRIAERFLQRPPLVGPDTDAFRLVNSEGDFLPGLTVDLYAGHAVCQFQTAGIERLREDVVSALTAAGACSILARDDAPARPLEGLPSGLRQLAGETPPSVAVRERGMRLLVNPRIGQKTGLFLDQRENRALAGRLAAGRRMLNCFAYTGGFSVASALGGADRTVSVEISGTALEQAKANFRQNGLDPDRHGFVEADVFEYLRGESDQYDLIVLDPPKFISSRETIEQGARGYKDINRLGLMRLARGGLLLTFSCSHHMDLPLFQKVLFQAAVETGRQVQILGRLTAAPDHPVSPFCPQGEYLKGFLCAAW